MLLGSGPVEDRILDAVSLESEQPLTGGRMTRGLVRVGHTIRRPVHDRSAYVQAALLHLEAQAFDGAPRFLGVDAEGREILTFIELAHAHHDDTSGLLLHVGSSRGPTTQPRNGKGDAYQYCNRCHPGAAARRLTRERMCEAMRAWLERYGTPPSSTDWSRTHARGAAAKRSNGSRTEIGWRRRP